jgi:hypothetical protein
VLVCAADAIRAARGIKSASRRVIILRLDNR